jgi:uncharacterized membrane protein (UPF0127 family)
MQIANITRNCLLANDARLADSFFTRLKGLLGARRLLTGEGLIIRPCNSVHTFGMKYAIDVVFADAGHRVLKTVASLEPGKAAMCRDGRYVVELPAGALAMSGTVIGDYLELS